MKTKIKNLIDFKKVDSLLEGFNKSTGFVTAILDLEGNVLSKSGWRQICTEFHRINPDTSKNCAISDTVLANKMVEGEKYHFYKCLNGLVDVAVPIIINGEHVANLFSGQFFFENPEKELFIKQAKNYGFNEHKYLNALHKVPVVSEEKVKTAMDFLHEMTQFISEQAYQKNELSDLSKQLKESEAKFKSVFESANVGKSITLSTGEINVNRAFCDMLGYTPEELQNKKWQALTPEDEIPIIQEFLDSLIKGKKDATRFEKRYICKNGSHIWADVSVTIQRNENGVPLHFITTVIDITERKWAEESKRISEERFRVAQEMSPDGFTILHPVRNHKGEVIDFTWVYENQTVARINGTNPKEVIGKQLLDLFPSHRGTDVFEAYLKVASTRETCILEEVYAGEILSKPTWLRLVIVSMGKEIAILTNDISERKQADEKLRESETRFRKIFEDGATGMVLVGNDFKFRKGNQTFCKMTGYSEEELLQLTFAEISHPDDSTKDIQQVKKLIEGKIDVYKTEKRYLKKDGQIFWAQLTVSPIADSEGEFLYNVAIIIDITERKQAEEDLIRISRIMKDAQEIAHLGSFEYDAANQTTIWSEEEFRIYGLNPKGPSPEYNVMLEKCIHPDDAKLLHETFMAAMQNQGVYELEHRIVRPDGSVRWVFDKAHPFFNEKGNLLRYAGATLDITERKQAEDEIKQLNAELELKVERRTALLEAANKELEAFSYSVSHDLRAPLRHINGYVDMLNKKYHETLDDKARHYLDTITGASSQMGTLIDDLLQFSRTGRKELSSKVLDLNILIKEVLKEMEPDVKGRKIEWEIQDLPKVFGDNTLLKLVWVNLLDNAVKYTRNQPLAKISIRYKSEAKDFVYCICDNGVGFDMKYANKLFGVFQRLHSSAEFEGTGIGLANVQRIISKHNGRIWAEAEPGKGARFYFSLPKIKEEMI